MEGFSSLESKLSSCWGFDPVCSSDVLLMPHARLKSIICEHEATSSSNSHSEPFSTSNSNASHLISSTSDKYPHNYPSMTLTSLTPFNLLDHHSHQHLHDDHNNNNINHPSCSNSPSLPLGQQQQQGQISFLTLDPLLVAGGEVTEDEDQDRVQILTNCFSTNNKGGEGLPKFEEIHLINTRSNGTFHYPNSDGEDDPNDPSSSEGQGIYFDIQDLSSFHHHSQNEEASSADFGDKTANDFLMEDLGDVRVELEEVEGQTLITQDEEEIQQVEKLEVEDIDDDVDNDNVEDLEDDDAFTILEDKSVVDEEEVDENTGGKAELKCKFCGFVCCSKSSLGIHERRHTGERPYACKHCGRLFNSAQCCKHHERLHTGDKPFECQYCGKKYAVSTRLKRHERVHTREEPYRCGEPGCGKTFRWFDAFRDHRNTHNGVPLYLCSVCGKSFTSYLKFYYHERGHFLKRERDKIKQDSKNGKDNKNEAQKLGPKTKKSKSIDIDDEGINKSPLIKSQRAPRKILQNTKVKKLD